MSKRLVQPVALIHLSDMSFAKQISSKYGWSIDHAVKRSNMSHVEQVNNRQKAELTIPAIQVTKVFRPLHIKVIMNHYSLNQVVHYKQLPLLSEPLKQKYEERIEQGKWMQPTDGIIQKISSQIRERQQQIGHEQLQEQLSKTSKLSLPAVRISEKAETNESALIVSPSSIVSRIDQQPKTISLQLLKKTVDHSSKLPQAKATIKLSSYIQVIEEMERKQQLEGRRKASLQQASYEPAIHASNEALNKDTKLTVKLIQRNMQQVTNQTSKQASTIKKHVSNFIALHEQRQLLKQSEHKRVLAITNIYKAKLTALINEKVIQNQPIFVRQAMLLQRSGQLIVNTSKQNEKQAPTHAINSNSVPSQDKLADTVARRLKYYLKASTSHTSMLKTLQHISRTEQQKLIYNGALQHQPQSINGKISLFYKKEALIVDKSLQHIRKQDTHASHNLLTANTYIAAIRHEIMAHQAVIAANQQLNVLPSKQPIGTDRSADMQQIIATERSMKMQQAIAANQSAEMQQATRGSKQTELKLETIWNRARSIIAAKKHIVHITSLHKQLIERNEKLFYEIEMVEKKRTPRARKTITVPQVKLTFRKQQSAMTDFHKPITNKKVSLNGHSSIAANADRKEIALAKLTAKPIAESIVQAAMQPIVQSLTTKAQQLEDIATPSIVRRAASLHYNSNQAKLEHSRKKEQPPGMLQASRLSQLSQLETKVEQLIRNQTESIQRNLSQSIQKVVTQSVQHELDAGKAQMSATTANSSLLNTPLHNSTKEARNMLSEQQEHVIVQHAIHEQLMKQGRYKKVVNEQFEQVRLENKGLNRIITVNERQAAISHSLKSVRSVNALQRSQLQLIQRKTKELGMLPSVIRQITQQAGPFKEQTEQAAAQVTVKPAFTKAVGQLIFKQATQTKLVSTIIKEMLHNKGAQGLQTSSSVKEKGTPLNDEKQLSKTIIHNKPIALTLAKSITSTLQPIGAIIKTIQQASTQKLITSNSSTTDYRADSKARAVISHVDQAKQNATTIQTAFKQQLASNVNLVQPERKTMTSNHNVTQSQLASGLAMVHAQSASKSSSTPLQVKPKSEQSRPVALHVAQKNQATKADGPSPIVKQLEQSIQRLESELQSAKEDMKQPAWNVGQLTEQLYSQLAKKIKLEQSRNGR